MAVFETELVSGESVAEGTMAFHFLKPAGFQFKAGQAMNVTLPNPPETDGKGNVRTFSIVSAPFEDSLMITTRMRDSAFKRVLRAMPAGAKLQLGGPTGQFTLDDGATGPVVFLAGGIGITPFVSMLRQAAHDRLARKLCLFYSNRRPEDAAYLGELQQLQTRNPNYRFVGTMTEMKKSAQPWNGEAGFIDESMLARSIDDISSPTYFIAGPPAMVDAMLDMLVGAGIKEEQVRTDEFFGY
jgi:ferredoxin-NADP reductase